MEKSEILGEVLSCVDRKGGLDFSILSGLLNDILKTDESVDVNEDVDRFIRESSEEDIAHCVAASMRIADTINGNTVKDLTVASQADYAATLLKGAVDIATGEISVEDLTEKIVDKTECRFLSAMDFCLDAGVELLPDLVASVFPVMTPVVVFAKPVLEKVSSEIKSAAHSIVHETGTWAKTEIPVAFKKIRQQVIEWIR